MRRALLLLLLLAGCSNGPEADLQYIKQARSAGAEWALVNEQASQGKLTHVSGNGSGAAGYRGGLCRLQPEARYFGSTSSHG